ncbi:MAG TPA: phosphoenolpyruvate carboxykinase (ATP) [Gemmatimonadales bacterium]|nr:phosphoenolpyruvate carboxykinase (ATP) [Gemmatimonadales bacterium]
MSDATLATAGLNVTGLSARRAEEVVKLPGRSARRNPSVAELYEHAIRRNEGVLAQFGPLCVITTPHTGRSPDDKFIVRDPGTSSRVWWSTMNQPLSPEHFAKLREHVLAHLDAQDLFIQDVFACADSRHRAAIRFVTPSAWHALFASNMFLVPTAAELASFTPVWHVLHAPELPADPAQHGTRSGTYVAINFAQRTILIGGTRYAGELKKSVFTALNYLLPDADVLPMHCSATVGRAGDVALFFGLSGTGKTTLSADPQRQLIGDDEHGWSDAGVFNLEGGCYAKVIRLSPDGEPEIYATTRMFGTLLENVVVDPATRALDLDSAAITENTRASYPISFIPNHVPSGSAGHPRHIIFLTCDAYGVLPPISRLNPAQTMYHFLSGYTAKVGGTERGVTEPRPTFSTCFGAPFLPRDANIYATMLGERVARHEVRCWLVNTGWTGGGPGAGGGRRIPLRHTRAMVHVALEGELETVPTTREPVFGLEIPRSVPGVPERVLMPREAWSDKAAYDAQALRVARLFRSNFQQFTGRVPSVVRDAGPPES